MKILMSYLKEKKRIYKDEGIDKDKKKLIAEDTSAMDKEKLK